jgi:ABC-type phosphate/phosphonate transport system ATPase subunit
LIDLLGIAVPSPGDGWLFRSLCAHVRTDQLTVVVSREPEARAALLDVISGRLVPAEGRAWIRGLPVARETAGLVRRRVGRVDLCGRLADQQSALWNVLWPAARPLDTPRAWWRAASTTWRRLGLEAISSVGLGTVAGVRLRELDPRSRRRLLVTHVLAPGPAALVVTDADGGLSRSDAADLLGVLRAVAGARRLAVLASLTDPALGQMFADRVLALDAGHPVFHGRAAAAIGSR